MTEDVALLGSSDERQHHRSRGELVAASTTPQMLHFDRQVTGTGVCVAAATALKSIAGALRSIRSPFATLTTKHCRPADESPTFEAVASRPDCR